MYAFWKYDLAPYISGGKLSKLEVKKDSKGSYTIAYIDSYQSWFRIQFTLNDEEGELLCNKIEFWTNEHREKLAILRQEYRDKFNETLNTLHPQGLIT